MSKKKKLSYKLWHSVTEQQQHNIDIVMGNYNSGRITTRELSLYIDYYGLPVTVLASN